MRRDGNRNFGVWNPPTGMDSIRRSTQVDFDLIVYLNNPKAGRELGIRQSFGKSIEKLKYPDVELLNTINNELKMLNDLIKQGWGGVSG